MVNRSLTFFGQRCRQLRIERGLSITDAAAKIGITRGYLSKLENGHKEPCLLTLIEIARGYGIQSEELFVAWLEKHAVTFPESPAKSKSKR